MENLDQIFARAEASVAAGDGLGGTGFWPAVNRVKKDPELIELHASRIAAIDDAAFRSWALLVIPIVPGTILALVATVVGLALIGGSYYWEGFLAIAAFGVGFGIILVTTHGLAHLTVGRLLGIRFVSWFIGTAGQPQPGVKVEYDSYLRTPARDRAWMHAAGAVVTKLMPFIMIGAAVAAGLPDWIGWALLALGVVQIVTDVMWSTKSSDWKKYRREMALVE